MNAASLLLVVFIIFGVTVLFSEGRIGGSTVRCSCPETNLQKKVNPSRVKKLLVFPPSASCSRTEIIIILKKGRKFCLDPNEKQGREILSKQERVKNAQTQRRKKQKNNKKQD